MGEKVKDVGVQIGIEQCKELMAKGTPGLHFYTLNLESSVMRIVQGLGLVPDWTASRAQTRRESQKMCVPYSGPTALARMCAALQHGMTFPMVALVTVHLLHMVTLALCHSQKILKTRRLRHVERCGENPQRNHQTSAASLHASSRTRSRSCPGAQRPLPKKPISLRSS